MAKRRGVAREEGLARFPWSPVGLLPLQCPQMEGAEVRPLRWELRAWQSRVPSTSLKADYQACLLCEPAHYHFIVSG